MFVQSDCCWVEWAEQTHKVIEDYGCGHPLDQVYFLDKRQMKTHPTADKKNQQSNHPSSTETSQSSSNAMPRALIATHEVFQGTSHNRGYVFAESGPGGVKYKLGLVPFDSTTSVDDVVLAWELPLDIIYMPTPSIITVPSIVPNMDIHTLKTNTVVVAKGARSAMTADALRGFPLNANLLIEAEILWRLQMTSPHPAIIHLYGLKMLRLTQVEGLVLRRYDKTLEQYGRAHLTDDLKRKVKDSITGAINHLRNVQLAHVSYDILPGFMYSLTASVVE